MTLNMEFSLEVVSLHQIMEPTSNMKMLLVWKLQNVKPKKKIIAVQRQDCFKLFANLSDQLIFCILHDYAAMPLRF